MTMALDRGDDREQRDIPHLDDWRRRAACRGAPVSWWFPSRDADDQLTTDLAMALCRSCPVAAECLDSALVEEPQTWTVNGIRGGLSAGARRQLLRARVVAEPVAGEIELSDSQRLPKLVEPRLVHLHRPFAAAI